MKRKGSPLEKGMISHEEDEESLEPDFGLAEVAVNLAQSGEWVRVSDLVRRFHIRPDEGIGTDSISLLHYAVNDMKALTMLLESSQGLEPPLNINTADSLGYTSLHWAINKDPIDSKIIILLIKSGADVNYLADDGKLPLHIAIERKEVGLVKYLVECGANTDGIIDEEQIAFLNQSFHPNPTISHIPSSHLPQQTTTVLSDNSQDIQKNTDKFQKNKAVEVFTAQGVSKKDLRNFNTWYITDILHYLTHLPDTNINAFKFVFYPLPTDNSFLKQFEKLYPLCKEIEKHTCFICTEPGQGESSHFIFGIVIDDNLVIINPIGTSAHKDLYEALASVKDISEIKNIFMSDLKLQHDSNGLFSCGPICIELMHHISQFNKSDILQIIKDTPPEITSTHGLSYKKINIMPVLPKSLKELLGIDGLLYKQKMEAIRQVHLNLVESPRNTGSENIVIQNEVLEKAYMPAEQLAMLHLLGLTREELENFGTEEMDLESAKEIALLNVLSSEDCKSLKIKKSFLKAINSNSLEEVILLLKKNPQLINATNTQGYSALHMAIIGKKIDMVKLFLEYGARLDMSCPLATNAFDLAKSHSTPEIDKLIQSKISLKEASPIYSGIKFDSNLSINTSALFEQDTSMSFDQYEDRFINEAMMRSAQESQAVALAEQYKSDFFVCIHKGIIEKLISLLETAPALLKLKNENGMTALHIAILQNNPDLVRFLLDKGHPVDLKDDEHQATPLHFAIHFGKLDIVNLLITYGADITLEDGNQKTPLQIANDSKGSSDRSAPIEEYDKIAVLLQKPQQIIDPLVQLPIKPNQEKPKQESTSSEDIYKSEYIRSKNPKYVADLKAADVNRCLLTTMRNIRQRHSPTQTKEKQFTIGSVSDWFRFNSESVLPSVIVKLNGDISRGVEIVDGSLVKSSIDINEYGESKPTSKIVEGYPSLNDKLLKLSRKKPNNLPSTFDKEDFTYPENPGILSYDRLLAHDLLAIASGQKPKYYINNNDVQFLTEVAVLLFGVENMSRRDSSNTQLGVNLLILDMISKKQKYGSELQHHFRIHNFLDSAKLIKGELYYKKTATYPLFLHNQTTVTPDVSNLSHDLELSSLPKTTPDSGIRREVRNNFASPSSYTFITQKEHDENLKSHDRDKKKADTLGGMSPSTTGTYTGVSENIYSEKDKFLRKDKMQYLNILKNDSNIKDHRILLKENKIVYYWLRQNAPNCFTTTLEKNTASKVVEALDNGVECIFQNKSLFTPLNANLKDINSRDFEGHTALHRAIIQNDKMRVIQLLKEYTLFSLNPQVFDAFGDTPLHLVAKFGDVETLNFLLFDGKTEDQSLNLLKLKNLFNENNMLHTCITSMNNLMLIELLKYCNNVPEKFNLLNMQNIKGDTPLHLALKLKNTDTIEKLLLTNKCNLIIANNNGDTPLHLAVTNNDIELVKKIMNLKFGKDSINLINKGGQSPLHLAVLCDNPLMIELLVNNGGLVNQGQISQKSTLFKESSLAPLQTAIARRKLNAIQCLNTKGAAIKNDRGNTVLHYLAATKNSNDHAEINERHPCVKIIQIYSKDINKTDTSGNTPLHIAIQRGQYEVSLALIFCDADVNIPNKDKLHTPLHDVLYQINSLHSKLQDIDKKLIEVNLKLSSDSSSPLYNQERAKYNQMILSFKKREGILNNLAVVLLNNGAKIENVDVTDLAPFRLACMNAHSNVLDICLTKLSSLERTQQQSLIHKKSNIWYNALHFIASNKNESKIVRHLIEMKVARAAQDKNGDTPLHIACRCINSNFLIPFFSGMDQENKIKLINQPNTSGETPFYFAVQSQDIALISLLVNFGADVNVLYNNFETPLLFAIKNQNLELATEFIKLHANINVSNSKGETPFHYAIQTQKLEFIKLVIENGADINSLYNSKETALHFATKKMNYELALHLIKLGANVNIKNDNGGTPLSLAIIFEDKRLISLLVTNGANVNEFYNKFETPLHYAIKKKDLKLISELIKNGADINLVNSSGETAIQMAERLKYTNVSELLKQPPPILKSNQQKNPHIGIGTSGFTNPTSSHFESSHPSFFGHSTTGEKDRPQKSSTIEPASKQKKPETSSEEKIQPINPGSQGGQPPSSGPSGNSTSRRL